MHDNGTKDDTVLCSNLALNLVVEIIDQLHGVCVAEELLARNAIRIQIHAADNLRERFRIPPSQAMNTSVIYSRFDNAHRFFRESQNRFRSTNGASASLTVHKSHESHESRLRVSPSSSTTHPHPLHAHIMFMFGILWRWITCRRRDRPGKGLACTCPLYWPPAIRLPFLTNTVVVSAQLLPHTDTNTRTHTARNT